MVSEGRAALLGVLLLLAAETTSAQERPERRVSRVMTPPRVDGVLDDPAWQTDPLSLGPWISYQPLWGNPGPDATEVRIA